MHMKYAKALVATLLLIVLGWNVLSAQTVEYRLGDRVFEMITQEGGTVLARDQETDLEKKFPYPEDEYDSLSLTGSLPIDERYCWPYWDFSIAKKAQGYGSVEEPSSTVSIRFPSIFEAYPWDAEIIKAAELLVGWVVDGKLRRLWFGRRAISSLPFERSLPLELSNGFPICFVVSKDKFIERSVIHPMDRYAFISEYEPEPGEKQLDRDDSDNTALHLAAVWGNLELAEAICSTHPRLSGKANAEGSTPLILAALTGRKEIAHLLLEQKRPAMDVTNIYGQSAMYLAARLGHEAIVNELLDHKADFKRLGFSNPAFAAMDNGHEDIAMLLMSKGARVKLAEKEMKLASSIRAFQNGYPDLGFFLAEYYKLKTLELDTGYNPFHAIASYADVALLDRLFAIYDKIGATDQKSGITPLDIAIAYGNVPAICWFIDNDTARNTTSKIDPVLHAVSKRQIDSVECLLSYGYDVTYQSDSGHTALMSAVLLEQRGIAELLADNGGAWGFGGRFDAITLAKLLKLDSPKLLQSAWEQGLDRALEPSDLKPADIAAFYDSASTLKFLKDEGYAESESAFVHPKELDEPLHIVARQDFDYPRELQQTYGDMKVKVRVGIDSEGRPSLFDFEKETPHAIAQLVEHSMFNWRFSPPIKDGASTSAALVYAIPFRVSDHVEKAFEITDVDTPPRILSQPPPVMPAAARHLRINGSVKLLWVFNAKGEAEQIRILECSNEIFAWPAIQSVQRIKGAPATKDGKSVPCRVAQTIQFTN